MTMKRLAPLFFTFTLAVVSHTGSAQATNDLPGGSDLPLVGRYPNSIISGYFENEFDSTLFPLTLNSKKDRKSFESQQVEGTRQVVIYDVNPAVENNTLKVYKSILFKLQKSGFKAAVSCSAQVEGCGSFFVRKIYSKYEMSQYFSGFKEFVNLNAGAVHLYSGSLSKDGSEYFLKVVVAQSKYARFIQYSIDLTKVANLQTKELVLTTERVEDGIASKGKVVLSGLYFEHNSTALTDESRSSLVVIAEYLKKHKGEKYVVVGHTDALGGYDYNLQLSAGRSESVLSALVKDYGVSGHSLKSFGASYISPVASNVNTTGRANNRRVELVKVDKF